MKLIRPLLFLSILCALSAGAVFAQTTGSLSGTVTDVNGAVVVGATVTVIPPSGVQNQRMYTVNAKGEYSVTGLAPGKYTVKVFANKFELYENAEVEIATGQKNELMVILTVGGIVENVDVANDEQVSTDPGNNADATVLKQADIDALPDDPDEFQAALQALVGGSAGPNGGQIYIDGFTGGQMPSKDQIREIRINSNPFSAENDRPGGGRIEILTRPGSERWRGSVNANFNDESLNSRNAFAANRAPTQQRNFGGNIGGPLKKGKSSFSLDFGHRSNDNSTIINAQVLDPTLNITSFRQDVAQPNKNLRLNPRFDFALNDKNTMIVRYSFNRNTSENQGLGETSLLSRAYESSSREHEFRITETMIVNAKTVNETRFEYSNNYRKQDGDNSIPSINVSSAFSGGGASIGNSFNRNNVWDVNNFTNTSFGQNMQHTVKFGVRLRHVEIVDRSENNYAGTFTFPGFFLTPGSTDVCDLNSDSVVSSIEQYRCKLSGQTGARFNPTQFSITTGNPEIGVSRFDASFYVSDDWKLRPDLMLSLGVRYENQTNISSNFNFAPRLALAWSPGAGGAKPPKFVMRGGFGIFYDRFSENLTLQAERLNGENQLNLLVSANDTDPVRRAAAIVLLSQPIFTASGVTNVPTAAQIQAALPQSNTLRQISPTLQSPYMMQGALTFESALTSKLTFSSALFVGRSIHQLRTRNVNAPVCPTQENCVGSVRPDPTRGNINVYESSGTSTQTRLQTSLRANLSRTFSFNINYNLGFSNGDTDGSGSAPSYMYDLSGEYGRSGSDSRHTVFAMANINLPWGINLHTMANFNTGRPFNITRGTDINGDGFFNERPTFAQLATTCNERGLTASFCDLSGYDPAAIIPRNFGEGPSSFTVRMGLSKTFGFGKSPEPAAQSGAGGGGGPQMVMMGGTGGGGGMMRGGFGGFGGGGRKPYNLNISINANNAFNKVNLGNPVGSISSSRFGQSTSTGGGFGGFGGGGGGSNRRVDLSMRFSW